MRSIHVGVGQLADVTPDALEFCFELATVGTSLEGAVLDIELLSGRELTVQSVELA